MVSQRDKLLNPTLRTVNCILTCWFFWSANPVRSYFCSSRHPFLNEPFFSLTHQKCLWGPRSAKPSILELLPQIPGFWSVFVGSILSFSLELRTLWTRIGNHVGSLHLNGKNLELKQNWLKTELDLAFSTNVLCSFNGGRSKKSCFLQYLVLLGSCESQCDPLFFTILLHENLFRWIWVVIWWPYAKGISRYDKIIFMLNISSECVCFNKNRRYLKNYCIQRKK